MKKLDYVVIGLSVLWLNIVISLSIYTGYGFWYSLGASSGPVITFGGPYAGYRIWQNRKKEKV